MANKGLFASAIAKLLPAPDTVNREDAPAYAYGPEALLAQLLHRQHILALQVQGA